MADGEGQTQAAEPVVVRTGMSAASALVGVLFGVATFLTLNGLNAAWLAQIPQPDGHAEVVVLVAGLGFGAAGFLAHRYPSVALWCGATVAALVVCGLALGDPGDVSLPGGGWDPLSIMRHGAHFPATAAAAGALLSVSISTLRAHLLERR